MQNSGGSPPTVPTVPTFPTVQSQSGGGKKLPPLSTFLHEFNNQDGGSDKSSEAIPFIGILALIILGGFSLNYLRKNGV